MWLFFVVASALGHAQGPLEFGRARLDRELAAQGLEARGAAIEVRVGTAGAAESFAIQSDGAQVSIEAPDASGAMYGLFELAERVALSGAAAFEGLDVRAAPELEVRALNPFLTLPWDSEKNEPVYDPAALTDPARWWFHDEDYWTTLFDLMAEARLNQLDLHGTYDIDTTRFPNLYAYFVDSPSFPDVGVSREIKQENLAQLAHVIELAHARGVKVSLMSYEAQFYTPHNPKPAYESSEANLAQYTREVVEALVRALPGLDAIGFRIGESGHGAEFFTCYLDAVKASGRDIPLYTRSWITRKRVVVPLAQASSDFTVEIKYNGEQWGPPYHIAGGRVPGWHSYSFEDYLSDSNVTSAARMWPGNVAENGERWPDQPYKIVWQVRANGTHRIFPFYEPDWVRRTVGSMRLGTARGFTVEAFNSYFPATPLYYLADPKDQWCKWIHQRDALWLIQWGRLGYDSQTPEDVFERAIERHLGKDVRALTQEWKAASRIVPTSFTAYSFGPDHRDHAPELERGGATDDFIQTEPFDSHVFMSTKELLALQATGGKDGRFTLLDARLLVSRDSAQSGSLVSFGAELIGASEAARTATDSGAVRELRAAKAMLGGLAEYLANRWILAWAIAAREAGAGSVSSDEDVRDWLRRSIDGWSYLSESLTSRFYKPFTDRLRMRTNHFHWQGQLEAVAKELLVHGQPAPPPEGITTRDVGKQARLIVRRSPSGTRAWSSWSTATAGRVACHVVARVPGSPDESNWKTDPQLDPYSIREAWLLEKPLPSSTFFHRRAMRRTDDGFVAEFERQNQGHLIAAEVETALGLCRIPLWTESTPYWVIPSIAGPTPQLYSSQEALTFLKPASLDPAKHGMLLICTRAWDFHRGFDVRTQRKLLDAVARGMKLLVLQQDYTSGRYPLDWYPQRPRIENAPTNVFDPAGALGLERVETDAVLWQPIRASDGWEVFGNGGIARAKHGAGEIWLCQARLMQRMHIPGCARNLKKLLELGGREKPTVVVDAGSEGNRYTTSVFCDFMNAHDIPFLTLGEVIVAEQGMDSFTSVPGVASAGDVLGGRGHAAMEDWLLARVARAAARPVPATRADFETERARRKRVLMRSLGLDPLPERTPLNARLVGTLVRDGYRIEKLVFESRPNFPVTAMLYVPDHAPGTKLPVIVNPHGHWTHKKSEPTVQARLVAQARHGYLALVVDSPGHSFEGDARIERRGAGTHDDPKLVLGSTNATAAYVWDLMRALDYLATRPEADLSRVGLTGTSGGGLATTYAFAADERFTCAVPVCYATSLVDCSENGCWCNHVPGTLEIGDRADVLAIRAPAPVFVIGARIDDEFPPEGSRHTGEKLKQLYALFDAENDAWWRLFDGEHDYSQPMREAALGFFDRCLRGGDGEPVPEAPAQLAEPEADEMFCLPDPPQSQLTLRDIARARLENADTRGRTFADFVELQGGAMERGPLAFRVVGFDAALDAQLVTLEHGGDLTLPALLWEARGPLRGALVLVDDGGKLAAARRFPIERLRAAGYACLALDTRGTGELESTDLRRLVYLGTSPAFVRALDVARALDALRVASPHVSLLSHGPASELAVLFAALFDRGVDHTAALDVLRRERESLRTWSDLFQDGSGEACVIARADQGPSLGQLREELIGLGTPRDLAGARELERILTQP